MSIRIAVIGAGSWGTALAGAMVDAGADVTLWARDAAAFARWRAARPAVSAGGNRERGTGVVLATDLAALSGIPILLLAIPAQSVRSLLTDLPPSATTFVLCAKGLEQGTGMRLSEVVAEVQPTAGSAVLSGPSFAGEVAAGLPTALALASPSRARAAELATLLGGPTLRLYPTDDVAGVEIGGALKNVLAIAAGAVIGCGLGENARAAVVTRGLAELARLGEALGARRETLMGLAGMGDLILTATSMTSRNTALGHALGQGKTMASLQQPDRPLAEGVWTAAAACRLAARLGVEVPVTQAVSAVLDGRITIREAAAALMARPQPDAE